MKKKASYTFLQQLFRPVLGLFLLFVLCFFFFQYQREKAFTSEKLNSLLANYNDYLHEQTERKGFTPKLIEDFLMDCPQKDLRITVLHLNGNVIYDSENKDLKENHANREEIILSKKEKNGQSIRKSISTHNTYFYSATTYNDYIFRTALPYNKYALEMLSINKTFIYFMLVMASLIIVILYRYANRLGKIIEKLRRFADHAEQNIPVEMDQAEFPHDDLGDIFRHIIGLYTKLQQVKEELSDEREKIFKHFQFSKEGFALFKSDETEILSNNFFLQYINIISDEPVKSVEEVFHIYEFKPIVTFINNNIHSIHLNQKIAREQLLINKNGKTFQTECILFKDNTCEISINDITQQEEERQVKKQLTQNIAHELKTPVSSIRGFLELIINNPDLPAEKKQLFLERCYTQTERLSLLLKDISILNSMEEAYSVFDIKPVHLNELMNELISDCTIEMQQKQMNIAINLPNNTIIYGNHSLLYSIFRNLLDNAMHYAGDSIQVEIDCYKEDTEYYYFIFSDSGVGIAEEHINRIFERFYRIDKGRSRKAGGTGLGLAIVKNAVLFHKGNISAKNNAKGGLEFIFTLKKNVEMKK